MAWIKVDQSITSHRKIWEMADELNIEVCSAIGLMISLWSWSLDNAPQGSLKNLSYKTIARGAGYSGDASLFVECLINVGFIDKKKDETLYLHDWDEYAGGLLEIRKKNADRQKKFREKLKENNDNVTRDITRDITATSCERNVREKRRVEKSREEKSRKKKDISLSPKTGERDESTESTNQPSTPSEKIRELWNETALSLGKVREIVGKRKIMLGARWKEHPDLEWWATYFDRIEASAFLTGKNDRGWKARFDWVIDPTNMNKILEGCYDDRRKEETHELTEDDYLKGFARTAEWCE